MRDMRELINLIEGAQDTQEPIVEEASEWQWQKLYEYNLKATLQNFAPKMIEQGLTKIFSSASTKGLFMTLASSCLSGHREAAGAPTHTA